jgi:hypothetical protein
MQTKMTTQGWLDTWIRIGCLVVSWDDCRLRCVGIVGDGLRDDQIRYLMLDMHGGFYAVNDAENVEKIYILRLSEVSTYAMCLNL